MPIRFLGQMRHGRELAYGLPLNVLLVIGAPTISSAPSRMAEARPAKTAPIEIALSRQILGSLPRTIRRYTSVARHMTSDRKKGFRHSLIGMTADYPIRFGRASNSIILHRTVANGLIGGQRTFDRPLLWGLQLRHQVMNSILVIHVVQGADVRVK